MALGTTIHPTAVMITPGKQIPGVKIQVLAGAPSGDNSVSDLQK